MKKINKIMVATALVAAMVAGAWLFGWAVGAAWDHDGYVHSHESFGNAYDNAAEE